MYGGVSIRDVNSREIAFPGRELQFRPGLRRRGTHVETHAGNATGDAIADQTPGTGDYRSAVKRGQMIGRHRGWSAHLMSALTRL